MKFYICDVCGNIVTKIEDSGVQVNCCGQPMRELVANTTDAATEKHVPVVERDGNKLTVKVGSAAHPMLEEHYIPFVAVETKNGECMICNLEPEQEPVAHFTLNDGDDVKEVYAYCNLHGLWKA